MRRLFAKFSLSDTNESSQPATQEESQAHSGPSDGATAPPHSPDRTPADSDTEDNLNETKQTSNPNRSSPITVRSGKRISESDDDEEHGDKRQRTSEDQTGGGEEEEKHEEEETTKQEQQHSDEEDHTSVAKTSEETSKNNKRQADTRESDTEDKEEPGSKVKRTRRLRRGLRLCTNITCYIEQVLYN